MLHTYVLLACLPLVLGSLYPTQPVQATVWTADQPMPITWIDDGRSPTLSQTGPFDIWLWRDTQTRLVRLAKDVDPGTKRAQVVVPGDVLNPGSKYTLRFTTRAPSAWVVYSADFGILPANGSTGGVALATPNGTTLTTTTTTMGWVTSTTGMTPLGTPPPSGTGLNNGGPTVEHRVANAGRRGIDVEKLKFRFVFVIWPVLMGITMAL